MKFLLSVCFLLCLFLVSCGDDQSCTPTGIAVLPATATADHVMSPGNTVQFFAHEVVSHGDPCGFTAAVVLQPNWTVSDSANVTISNDPTNQGTATCINHTTGQVTVTATLPPGQGRTKTFTATAKLTCN